MRYAVAMHYRSENGAFMTEMLYCTSRREARERAKFWRKSMSLAGRGAAYRWKFVKSVPYDTVKGRSNP